MCVVDGWDRAAMPDPRVACAVELAADAGESPHGCILSAETAEEKYGVYGHCSWSVNGAGLLITAHLL